MESGSQKWEVEAYTEASGKTPVDEFIFSLEAKAQAKVNRSIGLLKEFGLHVGLPHVKKMSGSELRELRLLGSDSIRILYVAMVSRKFLLLHGFIKKSQKTPEREIQIVMRRLVDFKIRNSD